MPTTISVSVKMMMMMRTTTTTTTIPNIVATHKNKVFIMIVNGKESSTVDDQYT